MSAAAASSSLDFSDVTVDRMIGQGKFSEVFLGHIAGERVAVKTVRCPTESGFGVAWREVELLRKVSHANVIKLIDAVLVDGLLHIIMELCLGGTLFDRLHFPKPTHVQLSWPQRMRICEDVASAMEYLHGLTPPIIHRDLKSLNLLLAEPIRTNMDIPQIKVADLGLGRVLQPNGKPDGDGTTRSSGGTETSGSKLTMQVGTVQWMAPELITSPSYTGKVDVYSFAIVLYEIAWQRLPFVGEPGNHQALLRRVVTGMRPDITTLPPGCPEELTALMKVCWESNPAKRPGFNRVHPWLKMVAAEKGYNTWSLSL